MRTLITRLLPKNMIEYLRADVDVFDLNVIGALPRLLHGPDQRVDAVEPFRFARRGNHAGIDNRTPRADTDVLGDGLHLRGMLFGRLVEYDRLRHLLRAIGHALPGNVMADLRIPRPRFRRVIDRHGVHDLPKLSQFRLQVQERGRGQADGFPVENDFGTRALIRDFLLDCRVNPIHDGIAQHPNLVGDGRRQFGALIGQRLAAIQERAVCPRLADKPPLSLSEQGLDAGNGALRLRFQVGLDGKKFVQFAHALLLIYLFWI